MLPFRRCASLIVASIVSTALLSATFQVVSGVRLATSTLLGSSGGDVVVVSFKSSRSAFTGIVPVYVALKLAEAPGVVAVSPEALAPVVLRGCPAVLRGVVPSKFLVLQPLEAVSGRLLCDSDLFEAMVGVGLAGRLGIGVGDSILVFSAMRDVSMWLRVVGVFRSDTAMDDEVLSTLWVGRRLRGLDDSYVSLVRARLDLSRTTVGMVSGFLSHEYEVVVRVVDAGGRPVPGLTVCLRDSLGASVCNVTDERGHAYFKVPYGSYEASASNKSHRAPPVSLNVSGEEYVTLKFVNLSPRQAGRGGGGGRAARRLIDEMMSLGGGRIDVGKIRVSPQSEDCNRVIEQVAGLTWSALWSLIALLAFVSVAVMRLAAGSFVADMEHDINVLRWVGASRGEAALFIAGRVAPLVLAGSASGLVLGNLTAAILSRMHYFLISGHHIRLSIGMVGNTVILACSYLIYICIIYLRIRETPG
ncbi:MAG: hypothetical protein DRN81_05895 [Thermoproteota archaeon]|nr:MAG: hypothetical protein DRN81_05895 [Candidatus Korarchaeota archaeon]